MVGWRISFLINALCLCFANPAIGQIVVSPTAGCVPLSVSMSGPSGASNILWTLGSGQTSTLASISHVYTTPGTYNVTYTAIVNGNAVSYSKQVIASPGPSGNMSFVVPQSHCMPVPVQFSGSGGSPGSTLMWSFGDLSPLAYGGSVTHTYVTSGSFVPILIIIDAVTGCTAMANGVGTVNVSAPPNLIISSTNGMQGCTPPFTTNISGSGSTSGSPLGGGFPTMTWQIQGGATPSSGNGTSMGNVTFGQGTHTITMNATDNNQCSGTVSAIVTVLNPTISAVMQPSIMCWADTVQVKVFSSAGQIVVTHDHDQPQLHNMNVATLQWSKALSSIGTQTDSVTMAKNPGLRHLTITINPPGCPPVSTIIPYFVEKITPWFIGSPPTSTCGYSMAATYSSQSTINSGYAMNYTWTADGGSGYNNAFPSPQTGSIATFTVTQGSLNPYTIYRPWVPMVHLWLQSTSPAACTSTIDIDVYDTIQRITSWFYTDRMEGCSTLTVTFRDSSFTLTGPPALFTPVYPISNYYFNTGGGNPASASGSTPHFSVTATYTAPGTYSAYLVVTGPGGCVDTSFTKIITVVNPPTVSLTYTSNLSVCAGQSLQINMTGTPGTINHWHVTTDDWLFSHCINNPSPSYPFTHTGVHGVSVTAFDHSCETTSATAQVITVKGPYGKLRYNTTCDTNTRKTVSFNVHLQETQSASLNFGDNSPPLPISGNPTGQFSMIASHTYSGTGNYTAVLTCSNSATGCSPRSDTAIVTVRLLKAVITDALGNPIPALPSALSCRNRRFKFKGGSSVDEAAQCKIGYKWFLNGPIGFTTCPEQLSESLPNPFFQTDTLDVAGHYTMMLVVSDVNSCSDTSRVVFRVSDMNLQFTASPNPICLQSGTMQIVNSLVLDPSDVVAGYTWDFGGGPINTSNATPTHTFTNAASPFQLFSISGTVTNNAGCSDSTRINVQVNNPYPNLQASHVLPCIPKNSGQVVTFFANAGYATYSISYNDPRTGPQQFSNMSNMTFATHNYSVPGVYVPTLTVVDNAGCTSTETKTIYAIGQPTATIFFADSTNKFCYPATPTIMSVPLINQTQVTRQMWKVGNVTTPPPGNQVLPYVFTKPGVTTISLTVDTAGFCPHTATAQVIISDPKAKLILDKKKFCIGDTIHVSIGDSTGTYVESWKWFFGDFVPQQQIHSLSVLAQITKTISYPYKIFPSDSTGKTTIVLRYEGMQNSCVRYSSTDIQVIKIDAAMKHARDDYRHCRGIPDDFLSITPNPAGHNLSYAWTFGDKGTGSGKSTSHTYDTSGIFNVQLTVSEVQYGCRNQAGKTMTILPLPSASLSVFPGLVCPAMPFVLSGTAIPGEKGLVTGTLTPSIDSLKFTPNNTFSLQTTTAETATYSIKVTDENTCVSKPAFTVIRIPDRAREVHWDTTVIIGQTVQLNANAGPGYTYTWTPVVTDLSCDSCYNPVSISTVNITYTVLVTDNPLRCFTALNTYSIYINPLTSLDVPSAFTPNGDGVNDIVYADGWGIRNLVYFRIFNRWGQLIFETNDLHTGWDGRFQGVLQNMETYVYQAAAETYLNTTITKTGTVKLLR
jgi:gliding motility-associated-like protein